MPSSERLCSAALASGLAPACAASCAASPCTCCWACAARSADASISPSLTNERRSPGSSPPVHSWSVGVHARSKCRTTHRAARWPAGHTHARTHAPRTHAHAQANTHSAAAPRAGGWGGRTRRTCAMDARTKHSYLQTHGEESQHCRQPGEAVGTAHSAGQHRRQAARVPLAAPGHRG
jgi:hypothetical protein